MKFLFIFGLLSDKKRKWKTPKSLSSKCFDFVYISVACKYQRGKNVKTDTRSLFKCSAHFGLVSAKVTYGFSLRVLKWRVLVVQASVIELMKEDDVTPVKRQKRCFWGDQKDAFAFGEYTYGPENIVENNCWNVYIYIFFYQCNFNNSGCIFCCEREIYKHKNMFFTWEKTTLLSTEHDTFLSKFNPIVLS